MDEDDMPVYKYSKNKCPYLTSKEDYYKTTIYPHCSCNGKYCSEFNGYCPVRD